MPVFSRPPFPELETDRLLLRQLTKADAGAVWQIRSNEQVMQYIDRPRTKSLAEGVGYIDKLLADMEAGGSINWAVTLKTGGPMIGFIGFHHIQIENYRAEIGYMLLPEYWGKGIVSESVTKIIEYGFAAMRLHSIEANINPLNNASRQLLLKLGFVKEGYFRENYYFEGRFLDSEIYSLLKNS